MLYVSFSTFLALPHRLWHILFIQFYFLLPQAPEWWGGSHAAAHSALYIFALNSSSLPCVLSKDCLISTCLESAVKESKWCLLCLCYGQRQRHSGFSSFLILRLANLGALCIQNVCAVQWELEMSERCSQLAAVSSENQEIDRSIAFPLSESSARSGGWVKFSLWHLTKMEQTLLWRSSDMSPLFSGYFG